VDIYVEDIAFTLEDLEAVSAAAAERSLPLHVHADQLGASGAAEAAVRLGARTADHLNHVGVEGIRALGAGSTAAVLLPTSSFTLRAGAPPARALADARASLAVATDFNPGTSPCLSMPEAIAMACTQYGLTPSEALTAATINGAWALCIDDRLGTLEPGKRADLLVLDVDEFREVPYRPGRNPVRETFIGGRRITRR
jgi:imidazolonepropionase